MKGLFDNLENLLPIIVFVVVVVSSWLKKKGQGDFETGPSDNDEPLPLPPKRAASGNWEEELRRLLEDERQPVVRPKSAPPPPIVAPQNRPPPLPTPARQSTPPPIVSPPRMAPAVSMPPPAHLAAPRLVIDDALPAPTRPLAHLTQSARAYDLASHLQEKVEARIAEVGQSHEHYYKGTCRHCQGSIEFPLGAAGTTIACPHCGENTVLAIDRPTPHLRLTGASQRKGASKNARAAVALLRGRQSARQAMIVSFILGPPKALED